MAKALICGLGQDLSAHLAHGRQGRDPSLGLAVRHYVGEAAGRVWMFILSGTLMCGRSGIECGSLLKVEYIQASSDASSKVRMMGQVIIARRKAQQWKFLKPTPKHSSPSLFQE